MLLYYRCVAATQLNVYIAYYYYYMPVPCVGTCCVCVSVYHRIAMIWAVCIFPLWSCLVRIARATATPWYWYGFHDTDIYIYIYIFDSNMSRVNASTMRGKRDRRATITANNAAKQKGSWVHCRSFTDEYGQRAFECELALACSVVWLNVYRIYRIYSMCNQMYVAMHWKEARIYYTYISHQI